MRNDYTAIRYTLLEKPTALEQQMLSRISSIETVKHTSTTSKKTHWDERLIIHYNHEERLATFKKNLHKLWQRTILNTPIQETRLIIGNRNNKPSKRELIALSQRYRE